MINTAALTVDFFFKKDLEETFDIQEFEKEVIQSEQEAKEGKEEDLMQQTMHLMEIL